MGSTWIRNLFIFLFLAGSSNAYSQTGKITDSLTGLPVEYTAVSLIDQMSHKTVTGTVSGTNGNFLLTGTKTGSYNILIEAIGFFPFTTVLILTDRGKATDAGTIRLRRKTTGLQAVTVTGDQKLIENKIDKHVYHFSQKASHLHIEPIRAEDCNCVSTKVAQESVLY